MAADPHNQTTSRDKSDPSAETSDRLSKWLVFSFIFHGIFVIALFVSPYLPRSTRPPAPVYTVDLVGGEKIGGNRPGTELASPRVVKEPVKKMASEPPLPQPVTKESVKVKEKVEKVAKAEKVEKTEKAAKVEKVENPAKAEKVEKAVIAKQAVKSEKSEKADLPEKVARVSKDPEPVPAKEKGTAINESSAEKAERTKDAGVDSAPQTGSLDKVREKLIQAAVDRVKSRAQSAQKSVASAKGADALSVGPGEGDGAAALGSGGRGGGSIVKGADFFVYQNKIVSTIKENWAWPGHKSNLKALVRFGIRDNGEIVGVKISEPSGDPSFDESILRALRQSSPLPAPPEPYRQDFSQVEMNFQP